MSTRFFNILICFFFTASSLAQDYNYQHYDLNNGLSGLTVYSMTQDKEGFMWFATETGLSRFDGSNFRSFTTEDGLPDNEVLKVYADSKNRLWILPFAHAICYYKNGKIYSGVNDSTLLRLKLGSEPVDIYEDKSGNIVVIENNAIHVIEESGEVISYDNIEGKKFTTLSIGENVNHNVIVSVMLNESKDRWGIVEVNKRGLGSLQIKLTQTRFLSRQFILLRDKLEVFRVSDKVHIKIRDSSTESMLTAPDHFIGLSFINDNTFTLNCSDTVFLYDVNRNKVVDQFSLGKIVNNCFKDNEGSYWFATTGYGVYRLGSNAFTNYNLTVNNNTLPVYSLYKHDKYVYCGTSQGLLWSVDLNTNVLSKERVAVDVGEARITGILKKADTLLIGSGQGIRYYANEKEKIIVEFLNIKSMYNFGDSLLIATNKNVLKMNTKKTVITDTLWNERATCAYKFNDAYYIGTLNGLYKVNYDKTIQFLGKSEPLLAARISSITSSGTDLWIATYGNGIIRYGNNRILEHITENNGLASNMCRVLYFNSGVLWTGTDKGLSKIVLQNDSYNISNYTSKDGLNCNIINCLLIENDTIFIGTPYGLVLFTPSKLSDNSISNLHVNVIRSSKYSWVGYQENINLEAEDNRFTVDYSGISFKSYGNILYYYRLRGLDEKWHTTRENIIDYASLPAGNYTLELYAINAFGIKSTITSIGLTVNKFFYQQLWFIILVIILSLLSLWYIVSRQIIKIKKNENEKLQTQKRLSELEQMAFRAQMNPHFIFNCLNSIQQYIFSKNVLESNLFITEFSSLIRQTMELSAKKFISLREEVKYLSTYLKLEHTRFDEAFDYAISVAPQLTPESIYLPPLLLQPFVENSIRHGIRNLKTKKGRLTVQFYSKHNKLFCVVEDNGIGRDTSSNLRILNKIEHQSKGMLLIQKRIEGLNIENIEKITLSIEDIYPNEENKGTRITLEIPL